VLFGGLQAATLASYVWASHTGAALSTWKTFAALEPAAGGMATAALFTFMMDSAQGARAASRYATQASTVVIASGLAGTISGWSAGALGYAAHFALCAAAALVAALLAQLYVRGTEKTCATEVATCA
jgi:hypothetical protein